MSNALIFQSEIEQAEYLAKIVIERDQALARLEKAKRALEKIAHQDTLDGDKYVNYECGWYGVAEFAKEALKELAND